MQRQQKINRLENFYLNTLEKKQTKLHVNYQAFCMRIRSSLLYLESSFRLFLSNIVIFKSNTSYYHFFYLLKHRLEKFYYSNNVQRIHSRANYNNLLFYAISVGLRKSEILIESV